MLAATLLWPLQGLAQSAQPQFIRLSFSHPDAARTMTITWTTESGTAPSLVGYGPESENQFTAEGISFAANDGLDTIHVVELTDLEPATTYYYRVGGPSTWSERLQFRTAPDDPCAPMLIAVLGDNRPDVDWLPQFHWNPILSETVSNAPDLLVHTGDLVKTGNEAAQWITFLESSDPLLSTVPFMATIGNHDDGPTDGDGAHYNQVFSFPVNEVTGTEDYYYFTYGDALFVSLSTQTFYQGETPFQQQAEWLDRVLTENPRTWKFVYLHHPPYTSHREFDLGFTEIQFNHPPNEQSQNAALIPVFDRHHVDIVFAGHNHYYERFAPLRQGSQPEEGTLAEGFADGTAYVITGGGGALTYDDFDILGITIDLVDWVCGSSTGSEVCSGRHHYVLMKIEGPTLTYEAWTTAEQRFGNDEAYIEMIDSFTIQKEAPDCSIEPELDTEPADAGPPDLVEEPQADPAVAPPDVQPEQGEQEVDQQAPVVDEEEEEAPAGTTSTPSGCSCTTARPLGSRPSPGWLLLAVALGIWSFGRRRCR
ncbi:MAG: metallophosphoesterase [Bradymonadales bacterium]|nr:metallophosphoesterase [Bradymonadales bacterium]